MTFVGELPQLCLSLCHPTISGEWTADLRLRHWIEIYNNSLKNVIAVEDLSVTIDFNEAYHVFYRDL